MSLKETVLLQTSVCLNGVYAKVKEKYFKKKYRPADLLSNVNIVISFKFKLQLQFGNKNYYYVIVNFHTGLH
jgi:hypothetical protein